MPTNSADTSERNGTSGALAQAGSVLAAAWSEFVARTLEMGGKRAVSMAVQSLVPRQAGGGAASDGIEALVGRYRQALGDLAERAPATWRYVAGLGAPGAATGARLLYRIPRREAPAMERYRLEAGDRDALRVFMSQAAVAKLEGGVEQSLRLGREGLARTLKDLSRVIDGDSVVDLVRVLDELKYDFKRRGSSALPDIRRSLRALLAEDLNLHYEVMDALRQNLGETASQTLLQQKALSQLGDAILASENRIPTDTLDSLRACHACVGLQLSDSVSLIARRSDGWVLDHEQDAVYEVQYFDQHYDVYGPGEGRRYAVENGASVSDLLLPYRIADASQGIAAWAIDKRIVNEELQVQRGSQDRSARSSPHNLEAWDIGDNKAMVVLCVVDHREGDLKAHRELVLCAVVAPKDQPLAAGIWPLCDAPVNTELVRAASAQIWGYEKVMSTIQMSRGSRSVRFEVSDAAGRNPLLTLTMPRGGEMVSPALPILSYTMKQPTPNAPRVLHRTLITRAGRGEQVRGGGAGVKLTVTPAGLAMPSDSAERSLYQALRRLQLVDRHGELSRSPLFSIWTEQLTAEVGAPALVVAPSEMP